MAYIDLDKSFDSEGLKFCPLCLSVIIISQPRQPLEPGGILFKALGVCYKLKYINNYQTSDKIEGYIVWLYLNRAHHNLMAVAKKPLFINTV